MPDKWKLWNNSTNTTEFSNVPITSHILNFPNFVCVLSQIIPITGSLIASHILATRNSTPTKAGAKYKVSVKYNIKKEPTRLQMASLPIAPIPKQYFSLVDAYLYCGCLFVLFWLLILFLLQNNLSLNLIIFLRNFARLFLTDYSITQKNNTR